MYYELNSMKENSIRFWKSLGFHEHGRDEYDMLLFIKRETAQNQPVGRLLE